MAEMFSTFNSERCTSGQIRGSIYASTFIPFLIQNPSLAPSHCPPCWEFGALRKGEAVRIFPTAPPEINSADEPLVFKLYIYSNGNRKSVITISFQPLVSLLVGKTRRDSWTALPARLASSPKIAEFCFTVTPPLPTLLYYVKASTPTRTTEIVFNLLFKTNPFPLKKCPYFFCVMVVSSHLLSSLHQTRSCCSIASPLGKLRNKQVYKDRPNN